MSLLELGCANQDWRICGRHGRRFESVLKGSTRLYVLLGKKVAGRAKILQTLHTLSDFAVCREAHSGHVANGRLRRIFHSTHIFKENYRDQRTQCKPGRARFRRINRPVGHKQHNCGHLRLFDRQGGSRRSSAHRPLRCERRRVWRTRGRPSRRRYWSRPRDYVPKRRLVAQ